MTFASLTNQGGRLENQDALGCTENAGTWRGCICDGLGGHAGGQLAALTARDAALAAQGEGPQDWLSEANEAVIGAQIQADVPSMRTTALVLEVSGGKAVWAHCGDSRLYLMRGGIATQLTMDHSVPQSLVRLGEIAPDEVRNHEDRSRLTRALGASNFRCDVGGGEALSGDVYLLTTDGFWEPILEEDMIDQLARSAMDPTAYLANLHALIVERMEVEHDNYSALALFV